MFKHRVGILGCLLVLSGCGENEAPESPESAGAVAAGTSATVPSTMASDSAGEPTTLTAGNITSTQETTEERGGDVVECLCSGNQVCDEAGQCTEAGSCTGKADCLGARLCIDERCVEPCTADADCDDDETCDVEQGLCVAPPAACDDDSCPGNQRCDSMSGRCVESETCADLEDCLAGRVCIDGACRTACTENADCPGGQTCLEQQCVEPSTCVADTDCEGGRLCHSDGQCQDPCTPDGCGMLEICDESSGRCRNMDSAQCDDTTPCPAGQGCVAGVCEVRDGCTEDAECDNADRCVNGSCISACQADSDCEDGQRCTLRQCVADNRCDDDVDCPEQRCVEGECIPGCVDADCPGLQTCNPGTGRCDEPSMCVADGDCQDDRVCIDGECADVCSDNPDCPGAQTCNENGRCIEAFPCTGNDDCTGRRSCGAAGRCADPCTIAGCPGNLMCDPASERCREVMPCRVNDDCFEGRLCGQDRVCANDCRQGGVCPGNQLCSEETGRCIENRDDGCRTPLDCQGDRICNLNVCEDRCQAGACPGGRQTCNMTTGLCDEPNLCDQDEDCIGERICVFGSCRDKCPDMPCLGAQVCDVEGRCKEPMECNRNLDCLGDRVCTRARQCGRPCSQAGCGGQQVCNGITGLCQEPANCSEDLDCLDTRLCVDDVCVDPCGPNNSCSRPNDVCSPEGRCVDGPCDQHDDCRTGRCVNQTCLPPCEADAECAGAQTCDLTTGRCAEPGQCTDADDCLDDRVCVAGSCQDRCEDFSDCTGNQGCDAVQGRCTEPDICLTIDDCLGQRRCGPERRCIDPCSAINPCEGRLNCVEGLCQENQPCIDGSDCFDDRVCIRGACTDRCAENTDCDGVLVCDTTSGQCVPPTTCNFDAQCGEGRICIEGTCAERCQIGGCEVNALCQEATGRCVIPGACVDSADCSGGQNCVGGRCQEPLICNTDEDCLDARTCQNGRCETVCVDKDDCPGRQLCGVEGLCIEDSRCDDDTDCVGRRRCHPNLGVCTEICPFGNCPNGALVCDETTQICGESTPCLDNTNCIGERICRLGRCVFDECMRDIECASGYCKNFSCTETDPVSDLCPANWPRVEGECVQPAPCDDETCPSPWACQTDGRCGRCVNDADCPGSFLCESGRCVDGDECENIGCMPGRVCVEGQCRPDLCEDDGAQNRAPNFASTDLPPHLFTDLKACESLAGDWFEINTPDSYFILTVRFSLAGNPLRLRLFDADNPADPIAEGLVRPGELKIAGRPGRYLAEVFAGEGATSVYSIELRDGLDCAQDPYDHPWRNDDIGSETAIGLGTIQGSICAVDVDRYKIGSDRNLTINVTGASAEIIVDGAAPQSTPATVQGPATVVVSGGAFATYSLSVESPASPADACQNATLLPLNVARQVNVSDEANDFSPACALNGEMEAVYAVDIAESGRLTLAVDPPLGPESTMMLYTDCLGAPLDCTDAAGSEISRQVDAGRHYIVLDGPYTGRLSTNFQPPSAQCDTVTELSDLEQVQMPAGSSDLGQCTDPDLGSVVRFIELDETRLVEMNFDRRLAVTIRDICADGDTERVCVIDPVNEASAVLPAGRHTIILQGEPGLVSVELITSDPPETPVFEAQCPAQSQGPTLVTGSRVDATGSTGNGDNLIDLSACAEFSTPNAAMAQVVAPFRLTTEASVTVTVGDAPFLPTIGVVSANCREVTCSTNVDGALGGGFTGTLSAGDYLLIVESEARSAGAFTLTVDVD
ncbi:MAG: hypothetical protein VX589_07250 [Myxococcota bacterium]|nr:hypothetical protein [Myxococcota bacterium]